MSEERKVVTVLFCDLVGFTSASESADPEDVRRWLAPYHSTLRQTVERYGGTVEKFAGDAILAVFGAPRSREDDAERAVRAGLAILEAVRQLPDGPLEVRIGIETGEALVQLTARPELGEPFVTGMVVNLAARLQSSAPIGAVVVGRGTHEATSRVFGYDALEPVAAKGVGRPVERWQAGSPRARFGTDVIRDLSTPMVGRQRDLTMLCTAFEKALAERVPQFVTLLGEPGIGKSRLVAEFGAWLDQHEELVTWREGRSLPYGETPFGPIAEVFKVQAGILDTDPPAQAVAKLDAIVPDGADRAWLRARVGPLVGADQSAQPGSATQEESFAAWRQLLESFAEQSPVVLVFEDLHWATDAMLAFIDHLAEWLTDLPMLVVVTARPELLERGPQWTRGVQNALTLGLSPLTADETDQLLTGMFAGQEVPEEIRRRLVRRADGNPLYAEELARIVTDCGPDQATSAELPAGIAALIAARLDTLEPDRKALLADAAVVGRVFWAEAVAALSDRDPAEVVQALQELARKELVRPVRRSSMLGQHEYTFWHALTRDVAYSQVPRAARSARHLAAADWLELRCAACQAETPNLIAYHLSTALDLAAALGDTDAVAAIAPRARKYQLMAAELAMNLDTREAIALLDRALELTPAGDPERPAVLTRWGWAAFLAGRLGEANTAYREAIAGFEAIGDIRGLARALRASTYGQSSMEESLATVDRAVAMLEELGPSEDLVQLLSGQASIRVVASRREDAIYSANRALRIAAEQGYAVPHRALESRGLARVAQGDTGGLVDIKEALAAMLELGQGRDAAVIWLNYGWVLWQIEGPVVALGELDTAREFSARRRLAEMEQQIGCTVLQLLIETGRTAEAVAACRGQLEHPGPAFTTLRRIEVLSALAVAEVESGLPDAGDPAEEAFRLAVDTGWPDLIAIAGSPAATTRARAGDQDGVLEILQMLASLSDLRGSLEFDARLPSLVRAALAVGHADAAAVLADFVEPVLPMREYSATTAQALLAEHRGDTESAAAGFARAAADWGAFGNKLEQAHALRGLHRITGDPGALAQAEQLFRP
ncbi:AAA ATPase-like protein [Kribbella sp. VKM Ac-2571]|uniref:AAA family ATPase n=1 Tax=Kribbella sp. VKM Ac-2571 TaxID=2512222 RepID=UPI00105D27D0|nr:adenylate/guanylate cyclase domain-containing protein [Kribbella sp. VKM Ac-2571]TDO47589.1 AAA ATPase-like protein [Kribbella sp. VKM Ac-2571]